MRTLRRGVIASLLITSLLSFYLTFIACGYRIEVELGRSLEPILGRYAILLVQYDPSEYRIGDIVTAIEAGDTQILHYRKILSDIVIYPIKTADGQYFTYLTFVHLTTPTQDLGLFPVTALRARVVLVLFRGFVARKTVETKKVGSVSPTKTNKGEETPCLLPNNNKK